MQNIQDWRPTKAELHGGSWRASRDPKEVAPGSRAMADWIIAAYEQAIRQHARGVIVDVGCGTMPYYGIYRDQVTEAIGVDWPGSPHQTSHVDLYCDLNDAILIADASVDTILCTDVLEHIFKPDKLWREMFRVLRADGVGIIAVPFMYWIHEAPHDFHRYTRFALEKYATDAGFAVIGIQPVGGLPHVLIDLLSKAAGRLSLASEVVRLLGNATLRIPTVRRAAARSAEKFPLAYVMIVARPGSTRHRSQQASEQDLRPSP